MSVMQSADLRSAAGSAGHLLDSADEAVKELPALRRAATERKSRPLNRAEDEYHSQRPSSEGRMESISPEQFAALPPAIQKKYFSSVERLRIAQQGAAGRRKKQRRKQTWLCPRSTRALTTESTAAPELRPSTSQSTKQRSFILQADQDAITKDQAEWFVALPDKVRKQHFSKEELAQLSERCEKALQTTTPETDRSQLDIEVSLGLSRTKGEVHSCPPSDQEQSPESDGLSVRTIRVGDTEMGMLKLYSRRRASIAPTVSSVPPPQPTYAPPPPPPQHRGKPKRKSFHRALSLTPLVLPPPTLAPAPPLPSPSTIKSFVVSARLSGPYIESVPFQAAEPPEAKHYQDPNARRQLCQYLASPENFDEAIEFGFPSPDRVAPPSSSGTDRDFRIQQTPSLFGFDFDDTSSESHGPPTPTAESDGYHRHPTVVQSASFDSGIGLPQQLNMAGKAGDLNSRSSSLSSRREMTLRMTLTRPELRIAKEKPFSFERSRTSSTESAAVADPLALEALSVCDDATGAHGAFAVQRSDNQTGLKRVWKSMRRC